MNPKLWLTIMFLISRIGILDATGQCLEQERSIGGMYLRGHTFKVYQVGLPVECYFRCEEEVTCQSYNVVAGKNVCELSNRTKEATPEDFIPDQERFYMKRSRNRVPLGSIEELPADTCSEIKASEGDEMADGKYWIYSEENSKVIQAYCKESWQKINGEKPVCFGAKDNHYGSFNMTKSGRVETMKLIHRSGSVRCNHVTSASYWACTYKEYGENLMTIITDADKKPVFPPAEDFNKDSYSLPGYHHNSTELVFRRLVTPLSVMSNQEMQIWYGQDWKDTSEENNSGKVCADIFAWYA
ncbi:uncharacterized protein LOC111346276 [Stylophora pistillata]|uniref:uncharacterized protein LOC111346276 n=1 Tax=Stylophora pistillata TaxID=50429 RepID=UPI000C052952|nr:uncharacterized protein LOC111346276 [Stylophora pistillata]